MWDHRGHCGWNTQKGAAAKAAVYVMRVRMCTSGQGIGVQGAGVQMDPLKPHILVR